MSKKVCITLFAFLLVALVFSPANAQDGPVVITWFIGLGAGANPAQVETEYAIAQRFNDEHDDIELVLNIVNNRVARDTMLTLIAGGQAPDIVGPVGTGGANQFAGQWLDLQPLVDSTGYDLTQFPQAAVDFYRVEGEGLVGLPFATYPSAIFYNRDLFDEAGLAYPPAEWGAPYIDAEGNEREWNLETLQELAMKLTVDANGNDATSPDFDPEQIVQWGYMNQWGDPRGQATIISGQGGSMVDDAGNAVIPDSWRAAYNWIYDGIWRHHFIPNTAQAQSDALNQGNVFRSGNVAMVNIHLWYTCCLEDSGINWDVGAAPAHDGHFVSKLHADTFRIFATTEHPEEAFEVLTYLTGAAAPELLQLYGGMPARESDRAAFFAGLEERYPGVENWDVFQEGLNYPDIPSHEAWLPNNNAANDRLRAFQSLYESTPGLDINREIDTLIADLQNLYDQAE